MRGLARQASTNPLVRGLALKILEQAQLDSHDFIQEAKALAQFVQQNVRYVRDPNGVEQLHDPVYLINKIKSGNAMGDCDDQALLLASLLLSIGAQPYFTIVRYRNTSGAYNHIYTVVYDQDWQKNKIRLVMDTIIKDKEIGFEVPHKSIREIPV